MKAEARIFRDATTGVGELPIAQERPGILLSSLLLPRPHSHYTRTLSRHHLPGLTRLDVTRALQMHGMLGRCIRKLPSPSGKYIDENGDKVDVETFPLWSEPWRNMYHYGCSVAVMLNMHFYQQAPSSHTSQFPRQRTQSPKSIDLHFLLVINGLITFDESGWQAAGLLMLLFVLSLFAVADNWSRNTSRNECRDALFASYDALTSSQNGSSWTRCGFSDLPMCA